MKTIVISSKKYGEKHVFIDDEDFEMISNINWCLRKCGENFYAHSPKYIGGGRANRKNFSQLMHKLVLPCNDSEVIDHIDGNGLNNQKINLRICTQQQNCFNRSRLNKNNISGYMGVTWHKKAEKYMASITKGGKRFYLGLYSSIEEAARTRDKKAIEMFGEFASLNFK